MSASYHWRKAEPTPPPQGEFGIGLADLLARRFFDPLASPQVSVDRMQLDGIPLGCNEDVAYLQGIRDVTANGSDLRADAQNLLDAIAENGAIVIEVER